MSELLSQAIEFGKLAGFIAFLVVFCAFSIFEIAMFVRFLCRMWKENGGESKK